ncbi:phospholipid carrier-dependent glycosyltransferase [soil metagenome]
MARRSPRPRPEPKPEPEPRSPSPDRRRFWSPLRLALVVLAILALQWSLAVRSLLTESPTVDEVVHLPAGVSYWQTGTFQLYPHNPPLIKLLAALPVLAAEPITEPLYQEPAWGWRDANKAAFAHGFALYNAETYFDLFQRARVLMPLFSLLGGLIVFDWSRRLYGPWGGILSLALWTLCPNILAHARLLTTDLGATVLGFGATYLFWQYLRRPGWGMAVLAGLALGLAQLSKFSNLLLLGIWPMLWLVREFLSERPEGRLQRFKKAIGQGVAMVGLCVLVINVGYGFEGVGERLGRFSFTSKLLTVERERPIAPALEPGCEGVPLPVALSMFRVNRFRGTLLEGLPVPLPRYYVLGFDDQKLEAEGVPNKILLATENAQAALRWGEQGDEISGYPVYLDGDLRNESWWYYYWMTLLYKVPEGTWALVLLSIVVLCVSPRSRTEWADALTLWIVPAVVLVVMSFGTNIALGLRYVLPMFPYVFVAVGKLAPWASGSTRPRLAVGAIGTALLATAVSTALIHPHYLAYFNHVSGGPERGSEHLIDSNLDWGQDLLNLERRLRQEFPGERVGIAYFGQINPRIFEAQRCPIDWFLPPALPGTLDGHDQQGPPPGLYAVSVSLVRGLPWRVYDDDPRSWVPIRAREGAFRYFEDLTPIDHVGHSIFLYRIDEAEAARLARLW